MYLSVLLIPAVLTDIFIESCFFFFFVKSENDYLPLTHFDGEDIFSNLSALYLTALAWLRFSGL